MGNIRLNDSEVIISGQKLDIPVHRDRTFRFNNSINMQVAIRFFAHLVLCVGSIPQDPVVQRGNKFIPGIVLTQG